MTPDRLEQLIRAADDGDSLQPPADLAQRVRGRVQRQQARARTVRRAAGVVAVLIAAVVAFRGLGLRRETVQPLDPTEIARLRSEADELAARAMALERQVGRAQAAVAQQELREEYERLVAMARDEDVAQTAIDRAASIAVTEGDFLLEVRGDRDDARAAYKRTIDCFPESHWAAVARQRIEQLNMN